MNKKSNSKSKNKSVVKNSSVAKNNSNSMKYGKVMEYGVSALKKNWILFLPNIFMLVTSICLLLILYNFGGIHNLISAKPFILNDKIIFAEEFGKLISTPRFTFSAILWFLGEILLGAYFVVMKYGMIKDVIKTGKTTLKSGFLFGEKNYLRYWGVHIISYLLIYGPFFILLGIYTMFVKYNVSSLNFSYLILGIFVLAWFVYAFLMSVRIFYIYPVMVFEKDSVFETFDDDFHYVKTHMGHTFLSFLIVLAFVVGLKFVDENVNIFSMTINSKIILVFVALCMLLLEIVVSTWEHMFVFKSYEEGKKLKNIIKTVKTASKKKPKKIAN